MTLWLSRDPIVLASKSASRLHLLKQAGIPVDVLPADIDERAVETEAGSLTPREAAVLLARRKAEAVSKLRPGRYVIGADQTLALDERRLSKPSDMKAAADQIRALAGKTHHLHSAFALVKDGRIIIQDVAVARMTMRPFGETFIEIYLENAGASVLSSVGAYQLEALGVHLFAEVEGDHATILGLPLLPLLAALREEGLLAG